MSGAQSLLKLTGQVTGRIGEWKRRRYEMEETYLVWSVEHRMWWLKRHGYTARLSEAAPFSRTEALGICARAIPGHGARHGVLPDLPVRLEDIETMRDAYRAEFRDAPAEGWE